MGSPAAAAWIAQAVFWGILFWGYAWGELSAGRAAAFVVLWLAGFFGLPFAPYGRLLFPPYVAILDIALVFLVFKGDVTLR